jgi:hypothetical protein
MADTPPTAPFWHSPLGGVVIDGAIAVIGSFVTARINANTQLQAARVQATTQLTLARQTERYAARARRKQDIRSYIESCAAVTRSVDKIGIAIGEEGDERAAWEEWKKQAAKHDMVQTGLWSSTRLSLACYRSVSRSRYKLPLTSSNS